VLVIDDQTIRIKPVYEWLMPDAERM